MYNFILYNFILYNIYKMNTLKIKKNKEYKIRKTRKLLYKPLNINLSEFRNRDINYEDIINNLIKFLNNNPSKEKLNKLYDTTIYIAESDSIGEDWRYIDEFTRQEFDILCKLIKINFNIQDLYKQDKKEREHILNEKILEFKDKYKNRKNISELLKKYIKKIKLQKPLNHNTILYNYLINNKILNNKELIYYKSNSININKTQYIELSFDLLYHLRIL